MKQSRSTNKAGKELDAMIAEGIGWQLEDAGYPVKFWCGRDNMLTGWRDRDWPPDDNWGNAPEIFSGKGIWQPSTDIAAAWTVVVAMAEQDWRLVLYAPGTGGLKGWTALFYYHPAGEWYECKGAFGIETAPLAICLAALKVKESQNWEDSNDS